VLPAGGCAVAVGGAGVVGMPPASRVPEPAARSPGAGALPASAPASGSRVKITTSPGAISSPFAQPRAGSVQSASRPTWRSDGKEAG